MPTSVLIANMLVGGVLMGGLYSLIAMGLSLQYGVARVLNLAHGEFIMFSGHCRSWFISNRFSSS
jgi:branched-chain amino acid transport system permease protein